MPMNRKLYPENWREISAFIRFERAKGKCEECGAEHGGTRAAATGDAFSVEECEALLDVGLKLVGSQIVLTTAHLGIPKPDGSPGDRSDRMDCRPENLKALCQRCHLAFDRAYNINRRRINRRKKLVFAGQLELFV